jgi:hypothetical protein
MKPVARAVFVQSVTRKGFQPGVGSDHDRFFYVHDGRLTSWQVYLSRGAKEIRLDEIANNARGMGIKASDLHKILCCEHDASTTLNLFRGVFPEDEPDADDQPVDEPAALKSELAEVSAAMEAVESEEQLSPLLLRRERLLARLRGR